jgi:hypothetical protein
LHEVLVLKLKQVHSIDGVPSRQGRPAFHSVIFKINDSHSVLLTRIKRVKLVTNVAGMVRQVVIEADV